MALKGMVPENVEQMAQTIEQARDSIDSIYRAAHERLTALAWEGEDRTRFIAAFEGELGGAIEQIKTQVTQFATTARSNASAQRETSSQ